MKCLTTGHQQFLSGGSLVYFFDPGSFRWPSRATVFVHRPTTGCQLGVLCFLYLVKGLFHWPLFPLVLSGLLLQNVQMMTSCYAMTKSLQNALYSREFYARCLSPATNFRQCSLNNFCFKAVGACQLYFCNHRSSLTAVWTLFCTGHPRQLVPHGSGHLMFPRSVTGLCLDFRPFWDWGLLRLGLDLTLA